MHLLNVGQILCSRSFRSHFWSFLCVPGQQPDSHIWLNSVRRGAAIWDSWLELRQLTKWESEQKGVSYSTLIDDRRSAEVHPWKV